MDILVTTPKKEIKNAKLEGRALTNPDAYWFRTFKFRPKVDKGDRIYFTENGFITGYGLIFDVELMSMSTKCSVTGREWGQTDYWMVKYRDWYWLKDTVKFKGFQGIRYISKLSVDVVSQITQDEREVYGQPCWSKTINQFRKENGLPKLPGYKKTVEGEWKK